MTTSTHARTESAPRAVITGIREFTAVALALGLILGALLLTVWRKAAFLQVGYKISDLEKRESDLLSRRRELEIEKSMLNSPERIERIARERLGMIDPEPGQVRILP